MFGAAFTVIATELKSRLQRRLTAFGLAAAAAILLLCTGGYLLDALHAWLSLRYGRTSASLIVAALLMVAAGALAFWAWRLNKAPAAGSLARALPSINRSRLAKRGLAGAGGLTAALATLVLMHWYRRHQPAATDMRRLPRVGGPR